MPLQQILTVHINKITLLYSAAVQTEQQRRGGEKERKGEMKVAQKVCIILALVGMTLIGDSEGISCKSIIHVHASISLLSLLQVVSESMEILVTSLRVLRLEHT